MDPGGALGPLAQFFFSSLIFSKEEKNLDLGPPYFVAWPPSKIMNHQPSP